MAQKLQAVDPPRMEVEQGWRWGLGAWEGVREGGRWGVGVWEVGGAGCGLWDAVCGGVEG